MPPGALAAASAIALARASTRRTASSKSIAPAAVSAAYSPSEWPAAASGETRSPDAHSHIEHRNSAG